MSDDPLERMGEKLEKLSELVDRTIESYDREEAAKAELQRWLDVDSFRRFVGSRIDGVWRFRLVTAGDFVYEGEGPELDIALREALAKRDPEE